MDSKIWGPPFWFILHSISMNYPVKPSFNQKRHHYDFFFNLKYVLPCEKCRKHYSVLFQKVPITPFLDSREAIINWVIYIHNEVSKSLGKEQYSLDQVIKNYDLIYNKKYKFQCGLIPRDMDFYASKKNYVYHNTIISVIFIILISIYMLK